MSGFEKRVALVEKWHTDLTKSLDDMYDLAEQVLDVWLEAEAHTEQRIIKLLQEHQPEVGSDSGFVYCTCGVYEIWYTEHLIELIKGETNG